MIIAQLSDIHVSGPRTDERLLRAALDEIDLLEPDLVAIPGTGREDNQLEDAGDVLALLCHARVDLVLGGHRHVPYVWPIAGRYLVHSGTVATTRTRGFDHPAYNVIRIDERTIRVDLRVPGGDEHTLGIYPRTWPPALATPQAGVFVPLPLRSGLPIAAEGRHG